MKYQKRENFLRSSNSSGKFSKFRPVLKFRVTQKAAWIWNMTISQNCKSLIKKISEKGRKMRLVSREWAWVSQLTLTKEDLNLKEAAHAR